MVSSRSGLVDSSETGLSASSSIRRTYLTACAGRSAHDRAPPCDLARAIAAHAAGGLAPPRRAS